MKVTKIEGRSRTFLNYDPAISLHKFNSRQTTLLCEFNLYWQYIGFQCDICFWTGFVRRFVEQNTKGTQSSHDINECWISSELNYMFQRQTEMEAQRVSAQVYTKNEWERPLVHMPCVISRHNISWNLDWPCSHLWFAVMADSRVTMIILSFGVLLLLNQRTVGAAFLKNHYSVLPEWTETFSN